MINKNNIIKINFFFDIFEKMLDSYYYILIEVAICFVITICLLYYYARKNINPVVIITAFLTWFLNLVLIVLLLFDIYYTQTNEGMNNKMPYITENIITYGYNIIYWSTFLLGWIFIPLMQSYEDSGEFTKIEKLKSSLKENLIFYSVLLVISIFLIVFTIIKFGIDKTLILLKDGSLIFGLVFFFFLLSYSLIKYPKTLYFKLNNSKQIQYHEWRAIKFFDRLDEDKFDLINSFFCLKATISNINEIDNIKTNDEKDIKSKKESINTSTNSKNDKKSSKRKDSASVSIDLSDEPKKIKDYLKYMDKEYDDFLKLSSEFGIDLEKEKEEEQMPITSIKDLIKLNRKIKRKKQDSLRMQCRIKICYNRWAILNTLSYFNNNKNDEDKEKNNKKEEVNSEEETNTKKDLLISLEKDGFIPLENFSDCKIFYHSKLKKYFIFIIFIIHIIAVIITIICEIIMMIGNDVIISIILGKINNIYILHITTLIPFIYLILMSNYTLFKIKISSFIYMYGHKQTDSVSLMVFSSYLSRIYFAVCLNCMQCLNQFSENKISKFQEFFGIIKKENEDNFIFSLCRFSPFVLFIFLVFFFFNIPGKLANFLGYNLFEFETEERDLIIKDGHKYLMVLNRKLDGKFLKYHDKKIFEER